MSTFIAQIKNQKIGFESPHVESSFNEFLKTYTGKVKITSVENVVSDGVRGYMFGAVIPFLKSIVPYWQTLSSDELYEVLKNEFNYFVALDLNGKEKRYGQSIMSKSIKNQKAMDFIQRINIWVIDQYAMPLPSADDYNEWVNSAPMKGEIYGK